MRPSLHRLAIAAFTFLLGATGVAASAPTDLAGETPRPRETMNSAELILALRRLQVMGSALYVAAHPDDENSAFLSSLTSGRRVRAAYLSLTRGDGGQNLIGPETGTDLGVIRTQELLAARRVDGAEQFFTRALDFGYSKNPEETLRIWDHERVLGDVVWVIRRFQPDVIVTRFSTDGGGGHGHHTASAILAEEAYEAAADPKRFPEQLAHVKPWRAVRLVRNVARFGSAPPDTAKDRVRADLGEYYPLLGRASSEIAGLSRSFHKSQGFGAAERRGAFENSFEHRFGTRAARDLFEGIDLTWARVPGGKPVGALLREAERAFDPAHPSAIVPRLLQARAAMASLQGDPRVEAKRRELDLVIRSALGLWIEANATRATATPGSRLDVTLSFLQRSDLPLTLVRVELPHEGVARLPAAAGSTGAEAAGLALERNVPRTASATLALPADLPFTQPYWLARPPLAGSYEVEDPERIGDPQNLPALSARVVLGIAGERLTLDVPVTYRWVDPVLGERYRALVIAPPVTCEMDHGVYLYPDARAREVRVVVEAVAPVEGARVRLRVPAGWSATPAVLPVALPEAGARRTVSFQVKPPAAVAGAVLDSGVKVTAEVEVGGQRFAYRRVDIDHSHIPMQTLFPPAEARLVRADVRRAGESIGYLMGAGDPVPEALGQMGFKVTLLSDDDLETLDLARFDCIVTGVRAFNTRPRLRTLNARLLEYVAAGGRLVVQYNTSEEALKDRLGPYPFTISRDRVTVEQADMKILAPAHPLVTVPNRIGAGDFAGWVQERGLQFANPFDPRYQTVFSTHDPGEDERAGGVLYARHGRGTFIYTGLAFWRQLPAGVPGAWRLFANLVSRAPGS